MAENQRLTRREAADFLGLKPRPSVEPCLLEPHSAAHGSSRDGLTRKRDWHKDDHRNTLIGAFASIVVKLNPECIVMENVPEMLSKKYWSPILETDVDGCAALCYI